MEFNLRQELLEASHRWQWILVIFVAGALLGWGLSFLLPVQYRAEADMGVFYQSDAIFRNVDDYKNWEMEQLQAVIFSDNILSLTQQELAKLDVFWKDKTPADLRAMLHVYWRNAGTWHLVAQAPKPAYAVQLVSAWKSTILQHVGGSLQNANEWLRVNTEAQMTARTKLEVESRLRELTQIAATLNLWRESTALSEKPLAALDYWRIYEAAARLAAQNPAGDELLASFPSPEQPGTAYQAWLEQALGLINGEQEILQIQQPVLAAQLEESTQRLAKLAGDSWGLSAFIRLDALNEEIKDPLPQRSSAFLALTGGLLGILLAAVYWLARRSKSWNSTT